MSLFEINRNARDIMTLPKSSQNVWGLRELVCSQYSLHEVAHQRPDTPARSAESPIVPLAHTPADVYKLLHQGEFGVGHIIGDVDYFSGNLARELMRANPDAQDPLLEQVSVDGAVFRVNLGPYRRLFLGDESNAHGLLLQVCLASASGPRGNESSFIATLSNFRELNNNYQLAVGEDIFAFPPHMLANFFQEVSAFVERFGTVPVLSHSPAYKRLNAPSYRVADFESLENSALAFLVKEAHQC